MPNEPFKIPSERPVRVLFVCLGNICRSPAAEIIFSNMVEQNGLSDKVIIDSAGMIDMHKGNPPDHRMLQALSDNGWKKQGVISRPIDTADFEKFDLIIGMDKANLRGVERLRKTSNGKAEIMPMCAFATQHEDKEVPDPYWGNADAFLYVVGLLKDACSGLLKFIQTKQGV